MLLFAVWLWLFPRFFAARSAPRSRGRRFIPASVGILRVRKPAWVVDEVIRLKALMGDLGCRKVAATFNRLHAARHATTALLDAIERYGKPRAIRTDNDAAFTSRLFGLAMWFLGIRHQRTEPHCPWQNGRIERFFGTLKQKLDRWAVDSPGQLHLALADFRLWYNHVRPHQHLHGLPPHEAWSGIDAYAMPPKEAVEFSAWDGMLAGLYLRR